MSLLETLDPVLFPWAEKLVDLAERAGVHPKVTSARRTYAEQAALYKRFQQGHSRFPAAPPGSSAHEWGFAFDLVVPNPQDQADLGEVWVRWQGVYGGANDPVHFEFPNWRQVARIAPAAGPILDTPAPTEDSTWYNALANQIVLSVPSPLRSILSIAEVTAQLAAYERVPGALGVSWLLHHPAEVTAAFVKAARKAVLGI